MSVEFTSLRLGCTSDRNRRKETASQSSTLTRRNPPRSETAPTCPAQELRFRSLRRRIQSDGPCIPHPPPRFLFPPCPLPAGVSAARFRPPPRSVLLPPAASSSESTHSPVSPTPRALPSPLPSISPPASSSCPSASNTIGRLSSASALSHRRTQGSRDERNTPTKAEKRRTRDREKHRAKANADRGGRRSRGTWIKRNVDKDGHGSRRTWIETNMNNKEHGSRGI